MKLITLVLLASLLSLWNFSIQGQEYGSNKKVGKYADINGIKLYYEIYGSGEPLILLHGNGGSIENFSNQIPELSKHYKVIAVDSRAQGRSTDSELEITFSQMASDIYELIIKLKFQSVNVLGWSDGGNVGLELAYAHPEIVKKLITFGANYTHENFLAPPDSVSMDPKDPIILRTAKFVEKSRTASQRLSANPANLPSIGKKLEDLEEKYPNFTTEQLRKIAIPVLVVAGDHDLINLAQTTSLFKSLPHSQLFIVPGATHIVLAEQPELMNAAIIKFIDTPYRDIDRYYFFK